MMDVLRTNKRLMLSLFSSLTLLILSLVFNVYVSGWVTIKASNSVTDIILDNVPVFDIDGIFIYGAILFIAIVAFICIRWPKKAPFIIKASALFIFIRAIFISLTHIGPFPSQAAMDVSKDVLKAFRFLVLDNGLFFSGHTGLPFLMSLIFWKNKMLRYFFITASIIGGTISLLGHIHYSIDVFAAFFIAYAIFHIAIQIFRTDWMLFNTGVFPEKRK